MKIINGKKLWSETLLDLCMMKFGVQLDYSRLIYKYVHRDKNSIVHFPNPTHAVSAVIDNIVIDKNDEILSTNLEYGSAIECGLIMRKKNINT